MWWFLVPIIVLGTILLLLAVLILLGRYRNGALLRPVILWLSKIGFMRRLFQKASTAALERQNPELASAVRKISTAGTNPQAMQKAMSRLTPAERRAYLEASGAQATEETAPNRQARRQFERMQQQARGGTSRPGGGGSSSRKRKRR
jgi:hypothetical protein